MNVESELILVARYERPLEDR